MTGRPPFRPAYALARARPLFIDAWPKPWHAVAPASAFVWLDEAEMQALGAQIMGFRHWFEASPPAPLLGLRRRLDAAIAALGGCAFFRLTSRSPKDSLRALRFGLRVCDGAEALAMVLEGSERAAHDLRLCLGAQVPLAFVVRPWLTFKPWQECRCTMRHGAFAGAAPPQALDAEQHRLAQGLMARWPGVPKAAVDTLAAHSPVADASFDLVIAPATGAWQLLDANPLTGV